MAYIEIQGVSKSYFKAKDSSPLARIKAKAVPKPQDVTEALKNLSFTVGKNEFFGLIGPDGAGKTTLMRIMASLLLPDNGRVSMGGLDVVADFRKLRRILGYMPGLFSLYQDLTVEENLKFFATVFGTTIHENYHLIRDIYVQIEPFKNRRAGKLSGGMKQKLALCCALIHKPEILILDEPTTGVDAVSRKEFWEMLKRLQQQQLTIIVSTPYMDDAGKCDRVALMQHGSILAHGSTAEITALYDNRLVAVVANEAFRCKELLANMPGVGSVNAFGKEIHVSLPAGGPSDSEISQWLRADGISDFTITACPAQIEDVFLKLMTT